MKSIERSCGIYQEDRSTVIAEHEFSERPNFLRASEWVEETLKKAKLPRSGGRIFIRYPAFQRAGGWSNEIPVGEGLINSAVGVIRNDFKVGLLAFIRSKGAPTTQAVASHFDIKEEEALSNLKGFHTEIDAIEIGGEVDEEGAWSLSENGKNYLDLVERGLPTE